jgi:hypothetical protein
MLTQLVELESYDQKICANPQPLARNIKLWGFAC